MSIQIFCPFFNQVVFHIELYGSLYILDISPLSELPFANIFSHSVCCPFVLFSFLCLLIWCSPICSFLLLFPLPEETYPKNIAKTDVEEHMPMFSSRHFMASDLIYKSLIHFEFIFVYDVRKWSSFIYLFFAYSCPVFSTQLIEELVFSLCIFLPPLL